MDTSNPGSRPEDPGAGLEEHAIDFSLVQHVGLFTGDWKQFLKGSTWIDAQGQRWRRSHAGTRLKIGGSHANSGAKPKRLREMARADLEIMLHRAREIAGNPKSKPAMVLKALDVLYKIGGLQSVALLNAEGEDATLPPLQFVENAPPPPRAEPDDDV